MPPAFHGAGISNQGGHKDDFTQLSALLVEDEPFAARLAQSILRQIGVNDIVVARDGAEALELLKTATKTINLVISDWKMPNMNGIELLKTVRQTWPDMPFLILTGSSSAEVVLAAREHHVNAYVVKPFSAEQLSKKIATALAPKGKGM